MSAIREEVSSVSQRESSHNGGANTTGNTGRGTKQGAYPEIEHEILQEMHSMIQKKQDDSAKLKTRTNSEIVSEKDKKAPHRQGRPIAQSLTMSLGKYTSENATGEEEEKPADDTFEALFYNKEEAAAFKAGKALGQEGSIEEEPTIEWSQR